MKKILLFLTFIGSISIPKSFAQLAAGDIAIIGYNTDSPNDGFTFITLASIPASEVIFFTEQGWNDTNNIWMGNTEPHLQYTSPAMELPCGSIVSIAETSSDSFTVTGGGSVSIAQSSNFSLSAGDQILAYKAANVRPNNAADITFITGLSGDFSLSADGWNPGQSSTSTSTSQSALPPGLTNGTNAIGLFPNQVSEVDNARYNGTLTGTAAAVGMAINNRNNWIFDNGSNYDISPTYYQTNIGVSITCVAADTEDPVITCPANVTTGNETGVCGSSTVTIGMATATDNVGVTSITNDAPATFPVGSTTVTWTAMDAAGNMNTCMQTVTITDTELPTIACPPNTTVQADTGENFASGVTLGTPITGDNCAVASVTNDAPANFPIGTTTVTWTVTDTAGNPQTCEQTVTVNLCNGITAIHIGGGTWIPGPPTANDTALFLADYNTGTLGNLNVCAIIVDPGITLTVSTGTSLQVTNDITVNGTLTFEAGSNFTQLNSSSSVINNGVINVLVSDPVVTTPAGALTVNTSTQTLSGTHTENGVVVHAYADADNNGVADNTTSLGSDTVVGNTWSFSVNLTEGIFNNFVVRAEKVIAGVTGVSADVDVPTITEDSLAPTVAITSSEADPTSNSPFSITITFSEEVTGFIAGDITVGNGAPSNLATADNIVFTADITPTANGSVSVDVSASVASDAAGNDNEAAAQFTIEYSSVLGIEDNTLSEDDFSYINPVSDALVIETSIEIASIEVYNLSGEMVSVSNGNTIDTSNLSSGLYIAYIVTEDGLSTTIKVVKK